jgi:hypothetical protein
MIGSALTQKAKINLTSRYTSNSLAIRRNMRGAHEAKEMKRQASQRRAARKALLSALPMKAETRQAAAEAENCQSHPYGAFPFAPPDVDIIDRVHQVAWAQVQARQPNRDTVSDGQRQGATQTDLRRYT